jgi:hypothetical protein
MGNTHKKSLYLDPELPRWPPDITLHTLRVGESTIIAILEGKQGDSP